MKKARIGAVIGCIILGLVGCAIAPDAEAARKSNYSTSWFKPKPKPRPVVKKQTTVVKKTTVVQNNTINQGRSGSGMGEALAGGLAAGVGIGVGSAATTAAIDAVFGDDKPQMPAFNCPEGFICEQVDGSWILKPQGN